MKRIVILVSIVLTFLASAAWAQQTAGKEDAQHPKPVYYDTFKEKWLDPAKWLDWGPGCPRSLECVREIQNGHLRMAVRGFADTDSDYGTQYDYNDTNFANPNRINSITADITLRSFSGTGCSTNNTGTTQAVVKISGIYFNTGSGDPADDVSDDTYLWVDTSNPKTMTVGNWMTGSGLGVGTNIDSYPIGTPLTLTNAWDKANHQFISVVKVKDEPGPGKRVVVPYSVSDTTPPANPQRLFAALAIPLNCTSAQTFAQVEAFFDNVMINVPPPPEE